MKIRSFILSVLLCVSTVFTSGCSFGNPPVNATNKEKYNTVYFDYFDTVTTIIGYAENQEEFDEVCDFIESELSRYDNLYDAYDPFTGIKNMNYVNSNAAFCPVQVNPDLFALFEMGKEIYELTDGMTNYAMGAVYSIWHDHLEKATLDPSLPSVPQLSELQRAA